MQQTLVPGSSGGGFLGLRKVRNRALALAHSPQNWLAWLFLIVFGYLILVPVGNMIWSTFHVQSGDSRRAGAAVGEFTMFYWERVFASGQLSARLLYEPLVNTLVVSLTYTVLAMVIGMGLAWLMVKTDMPFKKFTGFCAIVPYIIPSWTLALAWLTIFGNSRVGIGAAGFVESLIGRPTPNWLAYGPIPIICVLAVNYFAFAYLLGSAALATVDASLEESALVHGASNRRVIRKITLPIVLPAIGSAFILTFASGIGTFGVPAFLGLPVRYNVLATSLYQSAGVGRYGEAFVFTLVLVAISGSAILVNSWLLGSRKQFTTMEGKGSRQRQIALGRWRVPVGTAVAVLMAGFTFLPISFLVLQTFQYHLGQFSLDNFTLAYWIGERDGLRGILVSPRIRAAAVNTVVLGLSVGVSTAFIGILVGYSVSRNRGRPLSRIVEQVSFLPYVIPGIAFGAIFLSMFAQPRGPIPVLYGTIWIIFIACLVNRLPFASRMGISAMMQVGRSLEESAEVHGASFPRRIQRIMFPLTKRGFMGGFILAFVSTVKDINLVILLVTPRTMVLAALTFGYIELGRRQFADAIGVVIIIIVLGCTLIAQWITRTNPLQGFGGGNQ
ncbi:MAG: iron ABC transporter permease [Spirochaetaceae bacterium]|nr:MAG: iron ABC transporter permease [Spirochaetaceae bacterium]